MNSPLTFSSLAVKICGLSTPETMAAALKAGADMVGLVFHPKSPRHVLLAAAAALAKQARGRALVVALVVDMDDDGVRAIVSEVGPDVLQCHGSEDGARLAAIRALSGVPIIKAVGVAAPADLALVPPMASMADLILLDAKPPKDAAYPGGHGRPFDWGILRGMPPDTPFLLSGGLHPGNVAEAIASVRAFGLPLAGVDVSSGVESAPGVKDPQRIEDFIAAARRAVQAVA